MLRVSSDALFARPRARRTRATTMPTSAAKNGAEDATSTTKMGARSKPAGTRPPGSVANVGTGAAANVGIGIIVLPSSRLKCLPAHREQGGCRRKRLHEAWVRGPRPLNLFAVLTSGVGSGCHPEALDAPQVWWQKPRLPGRRPS